MPDLLTRAAMTAKTNSTLTAIGSVLTTLSVIPYEQGVVSTLIPSWAKPYVTVFMLGVTGLLRFWKARGWCQ